MKKEKINPALSYRFRMKNIITSFACIVLFLLITVRSFSQMAEHKTVEITGNTPWIIGNDEPEALQRAIEDVKNDWYKVFGHPPVLLSEPPKDWKGVVIYLGMNGPVKQLVKKDFPGPESFSLSIQQDNGGRAAIVATGADMRGSIYAAYALSEEILGVDPWYYGVDRDP